MITKSLRKASLSLRHHYLRVLIKVVITLATILNIVPCVHAEVNSVIRKNEGSGREKKAASWNLGKDKVNLNNLFSNIVNMVLFSLI